MNSILFDFGTTSLKISLLRDNFSIAQTLSKKINTYVDGKKITQRTSEWRKVFLSAINLYRQEENIA